MDQDIGLIGLAVMGQNLVLNMNDHGFKVSVYNRTATKIDEFLKGPAKNTSIRGYQDIAAFFQSLKRPRKIMLMVKAGIAVDELIEQAIPYLESGDILIDGGNSHFLDTVRRQKSLEERGLFFIGMGISGGEDGARHGPSIMPGGSQAAWPHVKSIFQAISAKVPSKEGMENCCEWVGSGGSGHFVKMVHNGIEYGDMQLIAEAYDILHRGAGYTHEELGDIFAQWNKGKLESYLIEITAKIAGKKDKRHNREDNYLLDVILDVAGQKGTGKWTATTALEVGAPLTLITESVFCRYLSSLCKERDFASTLFSSPKLPNRYTKEELATLAHDALYAAKIISYVQGFMLMRYAAREYGWEINMGSCALIWRGGCIIRSSFLGKIKEAFERDSQLELLLLDPYFAQQIQECVANWRSVVCYATEAGIPAPCLMSALSFYDGVRSKRLPTYLIQAQRDFFGAHTFERSDQPRGLFFHEQWQIDE